MYVNYNLFIKFACKAAEYTAFISLVAGEIIYSQIKIPPIVDDFTNV